MEECQAIYLSVLLYIYYWSSSPAPVLSLWSNGRISSAGGGEHSIQMPAAAAAADASGDESQRSEPAPEVSINRFVRSVAFVEWAGNAFGVLAFTWATVVLLGGFCSNLKSRDFWLATVMIFIEAFRIFSRNYTMDNHSLFGTTRALRWISSSFSRMLGRPQEGNEVVLIMSLSINLFDELMTMRKKSTAQFFADTIVGILKVVLLVVMSKLHLRGALQLKSGRRRRQRQLQLWAVLVALLSIAVYNLSTQKGFKEDEITFKRQNGDKLGFSILPPSLPVAIADVVTMVVAVLLLNLRPRWVGNRISSPFARKLVSSAKVTSALWSVLYLVASNRTLSDRLFNVFSDLVPLLIPFTRVVLSLGSLQKRSQTASPADRWIDVVMHALFLLTLVMPIPASLFYYWADLSTDSIAAISSIILSAALLVGNLQIPVAVVQVVLSSWRLHQLQPHHHNDYSSLPKSKRENLVPAITVFYVLALCQGALYIKASIIGPFSFFPRRSLARRLKLSGQRGAKAIDLYYQDSYATRMKVGVLSSRNKVSLAGFAMDCLRSGSGEMELAGVIVLDSLLQEGQPSEELVPRITSSYKEVSTLIAMLGWTAKQDRDVRLFAARVTAKLAGSVRIARFPGILNMVSSLLDAENQPAARDDPLLESTGHENGGNGRCSSWSWVRRCRQRITENWSLPKDSPSTHQNSLPVLSMVILEKLARDQDNSAEIFKDANLISKTIGLMSYSTNEGSSEDEHQIAVICSSLNFVRQLAVTGEKVGVAIRQGLWNHPFLLNNLAGVLEDARSSPRVWEPAMDIIAKLALDEQAGREIGRIQVITGRLLHAFLGRDRLNNMHYDQSLRKVAGGALANLALWGTANCSAILEEPGYEVIKDVKDMLSDNEYRYVTASLLINLCARCGVKLLSDPDASEHLSSALITVTEYIMAAEGKQLESLIGLASEISSIIHEAFVHKLESETNSGEELVRKLVSTLNSNKTPNPEYPRMRRVIVKIVITILESCHRTIEKMVEQGAMEGLMGALIKTERTPSQVEKYRVFYGNIGVVLESGEPMPALVARAKALIRRATQTAGGR